METRCTAGQHQINERAVFMLISHVIPAYNASKTISNTLESVFQYSMPNGWDVEAIVVDDGSVDSKELARIVGMFPKARLVVHEVNCGMCAGRNSGIAASRGDIVTILDSDDELIENWPSVVEEIVQEWPSQTNICYAACQNFNGEVTAEEPDYEGFLTLKDILNEVHAGEYIPLFRGDYVRTKPYVDLSMRKSCGIVSYINYALDGPFWVTSRVLRIYQDTRVGSVTHDWASPLKAAETAKCYQALFDKYGTLYQTEAPEGYRAKLLKLAVYMKLAGISGYYSVFASGFSLARLRESIGSLVLLVVPASFTAIIVRTIKSAGIVRRYG